MVHRKGTATRSPFCRSPFSVTVQGGRDRSKQPGLRRLRPRGHRDGGGGERRETLCKPLAMQGNPLLRVPVIHLLDKISRVSSKYPRCPSVHSHCSLSLTSRFLPHTPHPQVSSSNSTIRSVVAEIVRLAPRRIPIVHTLVRPQSNVCVCVCVRAHKHTANAQTTHTHPDAVKGGGSGVWQ